ncbi:threonine-phosphate decarboxylase CobD [Asaia astilbis]|uniref:threonine-phosphate decarboxylase CobD n=1 Tax=Asaia astilbis TaxID=610244 RepID=UPI00068872D7|nr:threonine-phosphate decarboxylase CobD [Asaia astilbis]
MRGQHDETEHSMTPWPVHGGQLSELARLFPEALTPWVDLSTGINPHAYPVPRLDVALLNRLPDPLEEQALRFAAAEAYGVSPDYVLAGSGTQMLIGLLPVFLSRFFTPSSVRILEPTYSGHDAAWREAGFSIQHVPFDASLALPDSNMVSVVCSPNNPTGRCMSVAEIASLADCHAHAGGLLVVDEAFIDFSPETAASLLPHPGLVICRSFGKAYGLAGLRIGFLLASHPVLHAMRAAMGPWSISTPGCHIGREALSDHVWRTNMATRLENEMAALRRIVTRGGMEFVGGTSLFSLFRSPDAQTIWENLARAGLLVRRFDWDDTLLRFGLPSDEATLRRLAKVFG